MNYEDGASEDTYSLLSLATTTDSNRLERKSTRKGYTLNVLVVGEEKSGKTTLMSALFDKHFEMPPNKTLPKDPFNPPVTLVSRSFELKDKNVPIFLTLHESKNYGQAICQKGTHLPIVNFIDNQFIDYYNRESGVNRRNIRDNLVHCMFLLVSAINHGLSELDIELLKAVQNKVNVILVITYAELLDPTGRKNVKQSIKETLERNNITLYQVEDPDLGDTEQVKRAITEIQDASPFAVPSILLNSECGIEPIKLDWGRIDSLDIEQSDYLHLKAMLKLQEVDLRTSTRDIFYEEFRSKKLISALHQSPRKRNDAGDTRMI